jgi:hypothetical protein
MAVGMVLAAVGLLTLFEPAAGSHHGHAMPRWWKPPSDGGCEKTTFSTEFMRKSTSRVIPAIVDQVLAHD